MADKQKLLVFLKSDYLSMGALVAAAGLWIVTLICHFGSSNEDRTLARILGVVSGAVSAVCFSIIFARYTRINRILSYGIKASAQVIEVAANVEDIWFVVLGYDFRSKNYQTKIVTGVEPPYHTGDIVDILIDPLNRHSAIIPDMYRAASVASSKQTSS